MSTDIASSRKMNLNRPLLFRITTVFVLVYSLLGTLFYITMLLFQIFDRNFLINWEYNGFNGVTIIFYLMLQAALHGGLLYSSVQLIKLRKTGLYIFTLSYIIVTLISLYMHYEYGWINTLVGLIVLIILLIYRKRLT